MKRRRILKQSVELCTGKYAILALTALNVCLACLVITLSGRWHWLSMSMDNKDFLTFFLIDYRVGFVSRALIGSILYLFTEHPTVRMVRNMLVVAVLVSLVLFAFLQAQIAKKALRKADTATLLASYLFFLNAIFWCNAFDYIGLLDIFMTLLMQLYLICLEQKRLLGFILAPVACFIGLLIHTAFAFVYIPVIAAILWFEILKHGKPDGIRVALFVATCAASVGLFILFVFFSQKTVRISADETLALLREKYDGQLYENYFGYYLYRTDEVNGYSADSAKGYLSYLFRTIDFSNSTIRRNLLNFIPLTALFLGGCAYHMRQTGNRKIAYLGFLGPAVMLFPSLSFSDDKDRFFSLILLAQYMLLQYLATQTDAYFLPCPASPPTKKLSSYETVRREERFRRILKIGTFVGLVFTLVGYRML